MRSTFKVLFYLKKDKHKPQPVVPVMGRITVNGTISQFSAKLNVPPHLWEVKGGRAKGKSFEADRINRHLDNIRIQIGKHYQSICDHDEYVSADKVKNAYLGFGRKYKLLLELCDEFCKDYKTRVDVDRTIHSLLRYQTLRRDLSLFVCRNYKVRDVPLAELDQSFAEKFTAYLKHVKGLADTTSSVEIKSLKHIVKKAFNDGQIDKNPFAYYYYFTDQPEIEYLPKKKSIN
ncbi:phage integrase SAM-like domain and Arm DNA-binding domain-containing protein [Alistipes provencensis]|uniref:phage integrase SAM-like domain and Arm DNA-binding domain-containing protein n=1 Tax=Alistipes provencensis TaxID=1816676 RepID=UPI000A422139|nr:phage integrase SAM-like domain and Arm DNA-binding domain-containing protein [Alistipes provencensis]